ncbi:MAG: putative peptidoglycan glycosyltransferase FtsW [Puniceicoccaceae bacterium]
MESRTLRYIPAVACVSSAILLAGFGLVCLYSALRGSLVVPVDILNKQILLLGLSLVVAAVISLQGERNLRVGAYGAMILGMLALLLVLIPGIGVTVNGSRRWLNLGISNVQASELAKVCFVLGMAHYLSTHQRVKSHWFWGFLLPMALIGSFVVAILREPDYGTAALFAAVGVTLLFLWGARLDLLLTSVLGGITVFGFLIYQDPVRWRRITSFLDVEGNKQDGAYQLYQGMLAFGSGGITGVGIGNGRQQLAYLPEAHTDFIMAVIGEELGLLATLSIVMLFAVLFAALLRIAQRTADMFWFLMVVGCGSFIIYQCLFNVGVVTGLLPTKGISLPFISYGGANLLGSFMMLGLIVAAWRHGERQKLPSIREL